MAPKTLAIRATCALHSRAGNGPVCLGSRGRLGSLIFGSFHIIIFMRKGKNNNKYRMRKWINIIESKLDEVIHEPDYPVIDSIAYKWVVRDYEREIRKGTKFKKIGNIGNIIILSNEWPLIESPQIFLFNGDKIVGQMTMTVDNGVISVYMSYLLPEYRGGVGFALYSFFLDQGYPIKSGREHTDYSRGLWQKIANHYRVTHNGEEVTDTSSFYDGSRSNFIAHPPSDKET